MANSNSTPDFFAAYPTFNPDPNRPILKNFDILARAQGWGKKRRHEERQIYLEGQYAVQLGSISTGKLQKWQGLCEELGVDPVPSSITQCKKVLKTNIHVNIIDLIDSRRLGTKVQTFQSRGQLEKYSRKSRKYFPLQRAKEDELKKILLRPMSK